MSAMGEKEVETAPIEAREASSHTAGNSSLDDQHDGEKQLESEKLDNTTEHEPDAKPDNGPPMENLARTDSQYEYPSTAEGALIMIAILLALFLVALDRTIIATAIPSITDEFQSLDDIGWYGSAFLLTSCTFQLLLGRIYTFYTPKYVFLGVILIFEIGSALCGAAPNSIAFIIGRAIAGIGSGGVFSGGIILMTTNIPLAKRPFYQGMFGAVFGISSVIGPLLGGVFTSDVTWRWCFYINLPIGGVVMLILLFILKPGAASKKGVPLRKQFLQLDPLGNFFLFPSIVCLLLALQWGGTTYAWNSGRIIALLVLFSVFFVGFVLVQIFMNETAIVPAAVIKNRSILAGMWLTFCLASGMMIFVYYVPVWFQAIRGQSAVQSGIDLIPMILALVVGNILSGLFTGRVGYYIVPAYTSAIIAPIGAGLISTFNVNTPENLWIGYQILYGFGIGCGLQQANMAAQTVLKRHLVPAGVSLLFFCQMLGGAIFISVGQNILDSNLVSGVLTQAPSLNAELIVSTGATNIRALVPADVLPGVLLAYNDALRQVYYVGVAMASLTAIGCFGLEWKNLKKAKDGKQAVKVKKTPAKTEEPVVEKV